MSNPTIAGNRLRLVFALSSLALALFLPASVLSSNEPTMLRHGNGMIKPIEPRSRTYYGDSIRHTEPAPKQPQVISTTPARPIPITADPGRSSTYQPSKYAPTHARPSDARLLPIEFPSPLKGPGGKSRNHDFTEPPLAESRKPTPIVGEGSSPEPPKPSPPAVVGTDRTREEYKRPDAQDRTPSWQDKRSAKRALEIEKALVVKAGQTAWYVTPIFRDGYYYYKSHTHTRPLRYGYWVFGAYDPDLCRKSVYFYYGCLPYVRVTRVCVVPYVVVSYIGPAFTLCDDYYLARREDSLLRSALADIRDGWLYERSYLITSHLKAGSRIAVFLDNRYEYSIDADDYADMTADAIDEIETARFTWQTIRKRSDGSYTAFGRHVYRNEKGETKTVYVMYTLKLMTDDFYITEVGSSKAPLG